MKNPIKAAPKIKKFLLNNESTAQTIVKNTFWLSLSESVGRALRIAIIIYAARVLGAAGWGTFSYMASLAAVFTIFADIGISTDSYICEYRENCCKTCHIGKGSPARSTQDSRCVDYYRDS